MKAALDQTEFSLIADDTKFMTLDLIKNRDYLTIQCSERESSCYWPALQNKEISVLEDNIAMVRSCASYTIQST